MWIFAPHTERKWKRATKRESIFNMFIVQRLINTNTISMDFIRIGGNIPILSSNLWTAFGKTIERISFEFFFNTLKFLCNFSHFFFIFVVVVNRIFHAPSHEFWWLWLHIMSQQIHRINNCISPTCLSPNAFKIEKLSSWCLHSRHWFWCALGRSLFKYSILRVVKISLKYSL